MHSQRSDGFFVVRLIAGAVALLAFGILIGASAVQDTPTLAPTQPPLRPTIQTVPWQGLDCGLIQEHDGWRLVACLPTPTPRRTP